MQQYSNVLIFLGTRFHQPINHIEQYLSTHLAKYKSVYCFEYPYFYNLLKLVTGRIPLIETISDKLIIYHSFGIVPFGRSVILFNYLNHQINYFVFCLITRLSATDTKIITFTAELALLPSLFALPILYFVIDDYTSYPGGNLPYKNVITNT